MVLFIVQKVPYTWTCAKNYIFLHLYILFGCKLSPFRFCGSDFGITPVHDITIGITWAAFCFHIAHILFASFGICSVCRLLFWRDYIIYLLLYIVVDGDDGTSSSNIWGNCFYLNLFRFIYMNLMILWIQISVYFTLHNYITHLKMDTT